MDWKGVTMSRIIVLLLLQAGVIPALAQSQYDSLTYSNTPRFSEYGDYGGRYFSGNSEGNSPERNNQRDFPLEQPSFFMFNDKNEKESVNRPSDSSSTTTVSSLIGGEGSYGGMTPPPPPPESSPTDLQVNEDSRTKYFTNDRHSIVPSSLRELEESYIRSLSPSSSSVSSEDRYGEKQEQSNTPGVENYSGFIMANRRYIKNNHDYRSLSAEQARRQQHFQELAQNAPITYGFPLVNEQQRGPAAKNSREVAYHRNDGKRKDSGKFFPFPQKNNIVPNFPDFSDRPPIPEEPESPPGTEDTIEQATRRPPANVLLPTSQTLSSFGISPPLSSPPSVFDPSFPGPTMERGFIPSFGPPTKIPFKSNPNPFLEHENNRLQQLQSHRHLTKIKSNIPTTSAVPVLRPEYKENVLPDEVGSEDSESDEKPREGRVYKHISVHVAAEDLDEDISAPKIVKVAKNPEKHIKVIFIKPPEARPTKTEVEVPANPQQKTLVYVLSESGGTRRPIKLVTPTPLKPAPPQVFFLRYTDPHQHRHPVPSIEREHTSSSQGSPERPIKQLASPHDPHAKLLSSTPSRPTFTTFGNPSSTLVHLQSTLTSPTLYPLASNSFETTNDINDPTNSRFQGGSTAASPSSPAILPSNGNGHLTALHYTTNQFPSSTAQPQAQLINNNKNPFYSPPNYYSSLYHLYPPPALTSLAPNQFPYYNTANIYQQQNLQSHPLQQYYHLGSTGQAASSKLSGGTAESGQSSSIQGLYTVAPYLKNLPGSINFNYLNQNPDGNNLPRTTRNYAMMTYAPTYMPSASGSDHVPVFTSPAEFIKSLLGDSYKFYNHIGSSNNNSIYTTEFYQFASTPSTPTINAPILTTTTPTPPPPVTTRSPPIPNQIPVVLNFKSYSRPEVTANKTTHIREHQSQPITIVISNGGSSYEIDKNNAQFQYNSNNQPTFATPINPHLTPSFITTPPPPTTTTSTTPQPRNQAWASSTPSPQVLSRVAPSPTPKQIINLPIIIYEGGSGKNTRFYPNRLANGETASIDTLFNNFTKSENNYSSEQSSEYNGSGQLDSSSASDEEGDDSSQLTSGEEEDVQSSFFDSSRTNFNSTLGYLNHHNSTTSTSGKRGKSRKRVNPSLVKPGRRLRKVRKPNRSKKSKPNQQEDQPAEELQSEISRDTRS